jgi:hypothetical protein
MLTSGIARGLRRCWRGDQRRSLHITAPGIDIRRRCSAARTRRSNKLRFPLVATGTDIGGSSDGLTRSGHRRYAPRLAIRRSCQTDLIDPPQNRMRLPEHLTAQLSKFSDAVALLEDRHLAGLGHDASHGSGGSVTELSVTENRRGWSGDKAGFNFQKLDELSDDNKKVPRDEQGNFVLTSRGRSY